MRKRSLRDFRITLALVLLTVAVFGGVVKNEFLVYDDAQYVFENPHLAGGLTWEALGWAFSADLVSDSFHVDYWQPLTAISHLLDARLFGMNPAGHHAMNLFYHVLNVCLVFAAFRRATGHLGRSGFAAVLFAIHPQQMEAVSWVAARKDLLSTFFVLLAILAYTGGRKRRVPGKPWLVLACYALSLMAKPMYLTFPILLLILDYWPLRRPVRPDSFGKGTTWPALITEKIPLILLGFAGGAVALLGQPEAFAPSNWRELAVKIVVEYSGYVARTLAPLRLGFYGITDPGAWKGGVILVLALGLVAFSALAASQKRRPYLAAGWFWFLAALAPTLGLDQPADRFMYGATIGLAIMMAWGFGDLAGSLPYGRKIVPAFSMLILAFLSLGAWRQGQYWRTNEALFERAIAIGGASYKIHDAYGSVLAQRGKPEEALLYFDESLSLRPDNPQTYSNRGGALATLGRYEEARRDFAQAIQLDPSLAKAYYNLGLLWGEVGNKPLALQYFLESLRLHPDDRDAQAAAGKILAEENQAEQAVTHLSEAVRLNPEDAKSHHLLGMLWSERGRYDLALRHLERVAELEPGLSKAHFNVGIARALMGDHAGARLHFKKTLALDPRDVEALHSMGVSFFREQRYAAAASHFRRALALRPDFEKSRTMLQEALEEGEKGDR